MDGTFADADHSLEDEIDAVYREKYRSSGARFDLLEERSHGCRGRLGRLQGKRVPDVRKLDDPRVGKVTCQLPAVLGQRTIVAAADEHEHRLGHISEPVGQVLGSRNRTGPASRSQ